MLTDFSCTEVYKQKKKLPLLEVTTLFFMSFYLPTSIDIYIYDSQALDVGRKMFL